MSDRREWNAMAPEEQDALIASGWHPGRPPTTESPFDVIRHSLNQLTDHGSQKCLDCLHHREVGMAAVDELERLYKQTVTKNADSPITGKGPATLERPGPRHDGGDRHASQG